MSILRRLPFQRLKSHLHHRRRRLASLAAVASVRQDTTVWTPAPLSGISPAAESLFHISIDVSDAPDLAASYTRPGQYLQLRVGDVAKPTFLAIASPPAFTVRERRVRVPGEERPRPIRSLIESGFSLKERSDVRLYYGARNLKRMAYQDRFKEWESSGVKIVLVLSQPDGSWSGETGYVQAAFARAKQIYRPEGTGAILCGQKQMTEEVTSILVAEGVSTEKILKNF
ncbi:hypothetical protein JRO89_XS05G0242700 [Xanthoceras sorbifolium]|uniref:Oxidoreductase FAD/NAD(P)-binding domain-containing protein n=1 Tax=Xanthoceras sorbifolium TaxID=99658 RepID=A0ABQ8I3L9_9ROSI|nr:hypothetical protein JRO89_XS05G0242700 [Xanthoceras sorbifolium]